MKVGVNPVIAAHLRWAAPSLVRAAAACARAERIARR